MATREEIRALTGLRGVAILLVIHSHYANWCSPFMLSTADPHYQRAIGTAEFGMTLFFTLSGFVIAYHYLDLEWRERPLVSAGQFMFLRLSRLYPVYLLFIVLQLKRIAIDSDFYGANWLGPTVTHLLALQSWYPAVVRGELAYSDGFSISWSISTEIGMYLMFAFALAGLGVLRASARAVAFTASGYVIVMFTVAHWFPLEAASAITKLPHLYEPVDASHALRWLWYISPYFRLAEFIMGGGAAVLIMSKRDAAMRGLLSIAAPIAGGLIVYRYVELILGDYPGQRTDLLCAACFAIVMANARADTQLNRALSSRPLALCGVVSYSLYLFHGVVTNFAGATPTQPFAWPLFAQYVLNIALSLTFAIALAFGLYRLIERPAQQALRRVLITSLASSARTCPRAP